MNNVTCCPFFRSSEKKQFPHFCVLSIYNTVVVDSNEAIGCILPLIEAESEKIHQSCLKKKKYQYFSLGECTQVLYHVCAYVSVVVTHVVVGVLVVRMANGEKLAGWLVVVNLSCQPERKSLLEKGNETKQRKSLFICCVLQAKAMRFAM